MPSDLYERIVGERGSLESLIAKIPGFKGYQEGGARREADAVLRRYLSDRFEDLVKRFVRLENRMLDSGGLQHMARSREVKSKLQSYLDRVRTASPKYSAMFASVKVGPDDLERIYAFDEAQTRYVTSFSEALDQLEDAIKSGEDLRDAMDAVYDIAVEAIEAFSLRDDVITRVSETL